MKVAIIGYGKMGKAIEQILLERGHEVVAKFGAGGIDSGELKKADVAIEFTQPEAAFGNLAQCFDSVVPVVTGTTGWLAHYNEAVELCNAQKGALLYASNFSLGVNLFFELNQRLAKIMNNHTDYSVSIDETHHTEKKDAPSGTAITIAEQIEEGLDRKDGWTMDDPHGKSQIYVKAHRIENIPGTHIVTYQSDIDSIEIKHIAHNRKGFALGAVLAAEFLMGKQGVYTMKDVLNL